MLVLRVIRQPRWDVPESLDWVPASDSAADPLADFAGTTENRLSVWFIDEAKSNLSQIVVALAAARDKLDKLDYVLFPEEHLNDLKIAVANVPGDTPDEQVNKFHRDLIRLSAGTVVDLTKKVYQHNIEIRRMQKDEVSALIADAVKSARIPLELVNRKLRELMTPLLGRKFGPPPAHSS